MEKQFVLRGVAAGALAGLIAFVFARIFAEPTIANAIDYETARAAAQAALDRAVALPAPPQGEALFSRSVQENVGLALGLIVFGIALGALLAVVFTLVQRGSGAHLRPRVLALLLAAGAFVSIYLVPFLKYPPNPPAVSDDATIATRGSAYLLLQVVSVVSLAVAAQLWRGLSRTRGAWQASLLAGAAYLVVVGMAMLALNGVSETPGPLRDANGTIVLNGFDPDVLYEFRLYALGGQLILWGVIGLLLGTTAESALRKRRGRFPLRQPVLV